MKYGYARVSSQDQNLERQTQEFIRFGIAKRNIYADKKSGKDFERTAYLKLIRKLKQNDLLVVKSIDRLGRNYNMIIEEWHKITHNTRGYSCIGYASTRYTSGRKLADGQIYFGRSSADTFFCSRKRARQHTLATGGRHSFG